MLAEGNEIELRVEFGQRIGCFILRPSVTFQEPWLKFFSGISQPLKGITEQKIIS